MKAISLFPLIALFSISVLAQNWPEPKAPAIPQADPYVAIPNAALTPGPASIYRAVFDATKLPSDPKTLLPAFNAVGGLMNDLRVSGTASRNTHFVIVFHGPATDGILDNEHYRAKYGIDNPNLAVLSSLKEMGVELYVCGQHLAANHIDPKTLSGDVKIAADAYLVLIGFQNRGYGSMWF